MIVGFAFGFFFLKKFNTETITEVSNIKSQVYAFQIGVYKNKDNATKNATTNNLNLSKKLTNEMVIYVFNKNELTTTKAFEQVNNVAECKCETIEVNNCVDKNTTNESTNNEKTKININTDSKEKLMTISGIGSSKADAIIEYRTKNGNFKTTEDIINVSGISKTIYDKIKDTITV